MVIDTRQTDSAMLGITERRVAQGVLRATPCRPHAFAAPRRAFRQLGGTLKFSGRKLVALTVVAGLVLAACGGDDGGDDVAETTEQSDTGSSNALATENPFPLGLVQIGREPWWERGSE